jgi:hypothetical protein
LPNLQVTNLPLGGNGQSSVTNMTPSNEIKVKESTNIVSRGIRYGTTRCAMAALGILFMI